MIRTYLSKIKILKFLYGNLMFFNHAIKEGLWRIFFNFRRYSIKSNSSKYLSWKSRFPDFSDGNRLKSSILTSSLKFNQGSHAIYLPPQKNLGKYLGEAVDFYPENAGFKILKDATSPEKSRYMANQRGDSEGLKFREFLTGSAFDQMIVANYMHYLNIGPRVYDVCCFNQGDFSYTVFVVEHVDGVIPSMQECKKFIRILKDNINNSFLRMVIPEWESGGDYNCPKCNGNLFISKKNSKEIYRYVDFQNFAITSPAAWTKYLIAASQNYFHFGNSREWRRDAYLYQSIPGFSNSSKRNTEKRWEIIEKCIYGSGVGFNKRLVLDIGCNSGMIMRNALINNAGWCLGWDKKEVVSHVNPLLLSLGCSRYSLFGSDLSSSYPLIEDIPERFRYELNESIVFYLAIQHHIGVIEDLFLMNWRLFVYEGKQKETIDNSLETLKGLLSNEVEVFNSTYISDGDSSLRPLLILVRKDV